MEIDTVEALLTEAIQQMALGNHMASISLLGEIRGHVNSALSIQATTSSEKWDIIRSEYEQGVTPIKLAKRYGERPATIRQKAWREQWASPKRVHNILLKEKGRRFYFRNCLTCRREFESTNRAAQMCNVCKAIERRNTAKHAVGEREQK